MAVKPEHSVYASPQIYQILLKVLDSQYSVTETLNFSSRGCPSPILLSEKVNFMKFRQHDKKTFMKFEGMKNQGQ